MTQPRQRILVLRYRFLGDTILVIPFLRQLRQSNPNAIIDVLVEHNSGELLTHCPYISTLIYMDKSRSLWGWGQYLKQYHYDTTFVLKRSWSSAILGFLSGAKQRIGFNTEGRGLLLTQRIPYDRSKNEALCFLDTLPPNYNPDNNHLELFHDTADLAWANELLQQASKQHPNHPRHVGIHITASNPEKDLPLTFWNTLLTSLFNEYPIQCHALGTSADHPTYEALRAKLSPEHQSLLHNHCGQTSLLQSQALISQYYRFLGVDSGLLHIAAAAQVPTLGYYLPNKLSKWAATPAPGTLSPQHLALTSFDPNDWITAWNAL